MGVTGLLRGDLGGLGGVGVGLGDCIGFVCFGPNSPSRPAEETGSARKSGETERTLIMVLMLSVAMLRFVFRCGTSIYC